MRLIGAASALAGFASGLTSDSRNQQQLIQVEDYDSKWQEMGACGMPSVKASESIVTGLDQSIWDLVSQGLESSNKGVRTGRTMGGPTLSLGRGPGVRPGMPGRGPPGPAATTATPPEEEKENEILKYIEKDARIVGGQISEPDTWPWQVHLTICGKWYGYVECNVCGASIISSRWLISAAHCVPETPSGYAVYGTNDLKSNTGRRGTIKEFIPHDRWNVQNFDYDLALVRPLYQMYISASSTPICLPHRNTCWDEHTPCVVTGWGLTDEKATEFPTKLRQVAVRLIEKERCMRFNNYQILTKNMMCAGYTEGKQDACAGDSGGPLVCRIPKTSVWVLAGTVSWGYGCARPGAPGVYTNLRLMVDWVSQKTKEYADDLGIGSELKPDTKLDLLTEKYNDEIYNPISGCFRTSKVDEKQFNDRRMDHLIEDFWEEQNNKLAMVKEAIAVAQSSTNALADNGPIEIEGCRGTISGDSYDFNRTLTNYLSSHGQNALFTYMGQINSENYPRPYPRTANCQYLIPNANTNTKLKLSIEALKLDCRQKNFLIVTDADGNVSKKVCRLRRPIEFTTSVGFYVQFVVPKTNMKLPGFKIEFMYIDSTHMCKEPKETEFSLKINKNRKLTYTTPSWPKPYPSASQCRWHYTILNPNQEELVFDFVRGIRTEKNVPCGPKNDNIIVFESASCTDQDLRTASIWGSLCGFRPARQIYNFPTKMGICVVWLADSDSNKRNRGCTFNVGTRKIQKGKGAGRSGGQRVFGPEIP